MRHTAYSDAYVTGRVFTLRIPGHEGEPMIIVHAFDALKERGYGPGGQYPLNVEVRQGGRLVRKSWCATAPGWTIDGPQARALVIECAHYRPEDDAEEGPEYEWCVRHADLLTETSYYRYGEI